MQYKIGDKVVITGNHKGGETGRYRHHFDIGATCTVRMHVEGDAYTLTGPVAGQEYTIQYVNATCFLPLFESVAGDVNALRERHGRLPTNSEGHEGGTTFDMNQNSI